MRFLSNVAARTSRASFDKVRKGFDVLFLLDVARELLRAVDVQKMRADASVTEAVDFERLGAVIGHPVGRMIAYSAARTVTSGGIFGLVLREIGGRLGARAIRSLLRRFD